MTKIPHQKDERDYARERFQVWMFNPDVFVREVVFANAPKGDGPTDQQIEGLQAVGKIAYAMVKADYIRNKNYSLGETLSKEELRLSRVKGLAIRSGHGCGKDAFLAWVYLWLLICFGVEKCRGQVTAPNQTQLRAILWTEFRYWTKYSAENCGGESLLSEKITVESDTVYHKEFKKISFILAKTANIKTNDESEQGEALAGAHSLYMILAADEASGLPYGVFKPIEGAMTQMCNFAILIGNGTRYTGYFFDCFHKDRARWLCLHWNAEDSPLVKPEILESDRKQYGRDSNWYRIRRLGEFPIAEPDALIPLEWILAAVNREIVPDETEPLILGCDIARQGGDKSVMAPRRGYKFDELMTVSKWDTVEVTGWINRYMIENKVAAAAVDVIGVGGGVSDPLRRLQRGRVHPVDVSKTAIHKNRFTNVKAELYWKLRELFEKNLISIPDDNELQGELSSIKFDYKETTGQIFIETKAQRKSRNLPSPNKADAIMLSLAVNDWAFRRNPLDVYDDEDEYEDAQTKENSWMGA